jgi:hypothetical protein
MRFFKMKIWIFTASVVMMAYCLLFSHTPAYAIIDETTGQGSNDNKPAQDSAAKQRRVRIPVKLTPYHKVLVKSRKGGELQERVVAMGTLSHHLRARIERTNHFYVKDWHIETIPQKLDMNSGKYLMQLRLYQVFGEGRDLEEYVGQLQLEGMLAKGNDILAFVGHGKANFKNKSGMNLIDIEVGAPAAPSAAPLVSKKILPAP